MILVLGTIIIFFIGLCCGVTWGDNELQKDVKSGIIKVAHKIYKVSEISSTEQGE